MDPNTMKTLLLVLSSILVIVGFSTGPLVTRLYFIHGGQTIWLSSILQTSGFPLILIPLSIQYINHFKTTQTSRAKLFTLSPFLLLSSSFTGLLTGTVDYLYAYASARLPVSTSSLIYSSQLAFTAAFAYVLVKQKFSPYSVNTIVLLIVGPVVLALHGSSDRPEVESQREYYMGFFMMLSAAVLGSFVMSLMEFSFKKGKMHALSYTGVMEYNLVSCISATCFSLVGMLINTDFKPFKSLVENPSLKKKVSRVFKSKNPKNPNFTSTMHSTEIRGADYYKILQVRYHLLDELLGKTASEILAMEDTTLSRFDQMARHDHPSFDTIRLCFTTLFDHVRLVAEEISLCDDYSLSCSYIVDSSSDYEGATEEARHALITNLKGYVCMVGTHEALIASDMSTPEEIYESALALERYMHYIYSLEDAEVVAEEGCRLVNFDPETPVVIEERFESRSERLERHIRDLRDSPL